MLNRTNALGSAKLRSRRRTLDVVPGASALWRIVKFVTGIHPVTGCQLRRAMAEQRVWIDAAGQSLLI